jgi:hypothetical protein
VNIFVPNIIQSIGVDCKGGAFALEFEDYKAIVMAYRSQSAEVEKESRQSFTGCE